MTAERIRITAQAIEKLLCLPDGAVTLTTYEHDEDFTYCSISFVIRGAETFEGAEISWRRSVVDQQESE